jgi:methylmalonyl-CoA mutase
LILSLDLNSTGLNFIAGPASRDILDYLLRTLEESDQRSGLVPGSLGFDPIGQLTVTGGFYQSAEEDFREADNLLLTAENELSRFRVISLNSHLFSDSGASLVQELAFGIAMAAEYLTRLTGMGHSIADITRHMQWNMGVGSAYFLEIAKIRAARLLFSGLQSAFDNNLSKCSPVFIHCQTTDWNKTLYDPHVNLLRVTAEAMAATLGGCNSLLVKPHDSWYSEPGEFSERIARNVQIILKEESYFDKVVDPSGGSYYIESLTNSLVENAWQLFLRIDERGGYVKAFTEGFIQEELGKTVSRRMEMISSRREVLVGTNQYPDFRESILEHVHPDIAFPQTAYNQNRIAEPLKHGRAAEGFEKLRLAVEKEPGRRPKVFMLTYGNLTMRLARSQFSCNFFACAGYEVIDNLGFCSVRDGVEAALAAKSDIIVVCSSDDEYLQIVPEVADLAGKKAIVVVAGAPACEEELRQKGITEFIHVRSNVLDTLKHYHSKLGI